MTAKRRGNHEGTLPRRRPDGTWYAAIRIGGGRRRYLYGRSAAEVRRKLDKVRQALEVGAGARPTQPLREWIAAWLLAKREGGVRPDTLRSYTGLLGLHVVPEIGHVRLSELRVDDVQRALRRAAKAGLSAASVNRVRDALRNCLNDAMREELITRNVAALARPPRVQPHEAEYLTVPQARALLVALDGHEREALFAVGLSVGLRPSEVLGLRWQDVDLDGDPATIRVRKQLKPGLGLVDVKTAAGRRHFAIPAVLRDQLRRHRAGQREARLAAKAWARPDLVFTGPAGEPLSLDRVRIEFYRALAGAGLPRIKLYEATRHTCASLLAAQGVQPRIAQAILGHANINTTLAIYTHIGWDSKGEAAAAIDRALG